MDVNVAQVKRQARLRYFPLKPYHHEGTVHMLNNLSPFSPRRDTFGDAIDHLLTLDQELGRSMFGKTFFSMIDRCGEFPLCIESYAEKSARRLGAIALREFGYRVISESLGSQHINFVNKQILSMITDRQMVRFMPLQPGSWQEVQTSDTAIAIVPMGGPLDIAHRDGNDILSSGNAAIIMASARLLVQGKGFFVFHPTGMPVR